jgi:formiminotetrahydrofolate cyclodeaminase
LELKSVHGLREFCEDVSSDSPAPGGGSASAAAGALSASLLLMVCKISKKAKGREPVWEELDRLRTQFEKMLNDLIGLAEKDSDAYERLASAARERKSIGTDASLESYERALRHAAEVPAHTARACASLLELSVMVAEIGVRGARSDVGVAVLLAEAGLRGAIMNVRVNLADMKDRGFAAELESEMDGLGDKAKLWAAEALRLVGQT